LAVQERERKLTAENINKHKTICILNAYTLNVLVKPTQFLCATLNWIGLSVPRLALTVPEGGSDMSRNCLGLAFNLTPYYASGMCKYLLSI
jgi:hypothetical protein